MNSATEGLELMRPTPKTAMHDVIDATRFACTLLKQLPVRPLLGVIAVSLTLGALPMMLTAIYSVIRTLVDCYRNALRMRAERSSEILNPSLPIGGESVMRIISFKPSNMRRHYDASSSNRH
jgi:short-subunit dehydrogenase involved in D-alanine esterification of teichoic acids